jgi:hypothetical protein
MERVRWLFAIVLAVALTPITAGTHVAFADEVILADGTETAIANDRTGVIQFPITATGAVTSQAGDTPWDVTLPAPLMLLMLRGGYAFRPNRGSRLC